MTKVAAHEAEKSGAPAILVVDDEAAARRVLGLALTQAGYEVVEATSGRRALELIEHGSFGLVLLDSRMPRMSGVELLRILRARPETRTLPIMLVTAADDVADRVAGLDAGASDYIVKPFDADEILARVRAQLREQEAWQDLVKTRFHERAAVAEALSRAHGQPTLELTANAICEDLLVLRGIAGATLLWFAPDGSALTLAASGLPIWGLSPAEGTPSPLARYLRLRADLGPWVERSDVDGLATGASTTLLASTPVACAPLGGIGQAWGLLLVSADHDASPTDVTNALSVAIDFAGVASSLLEEGLENRRRAEASRLGLATVLLQEAFVPHFQPIVNLDDNRSVGFEALTRFADGTPPDRRFAEATAMGLGLQLERATMASAVMAAESLPKHRWLSLNVSHGMLLATDLVREVIGETTRDIILEVSAQDAAADYESLRLALDQLGVEVLVALDDVTSRLAEFRRLLMLRPAFIKLDRTWVYRVDQDPARQAVILALRDLATRMDSRLIAVGVETESERDTLAGFGVHLGQGFLLGKPEPAP